MKKFSFTTTEYVEPGLEEEAVAHPPVEENLADEPMVIEFEETPSLGEGGPALFETPEEAVEHAFESVEQEMEEAPLVVTFEEDLEFEGPELGEEGEGGLFEEILEQIGYEEGSEDEDLEIEESEESEEPEENDAVDPLAGAGLPPGAAPMAEERPGGRRIPGTSEVFYDDPEPEPEPEKETNWVDDRDPSHFMQYLTESMNRFNTEGIPGHDGRSVVGLQRAIEWLKRLDREISEAIRKDIGNDIDAHQVEQVRQKIDEYISTLKEHLGKVKKKASPSDMESKLIAMGRNEIEKEATVARIQVVMTPFERAISGILINAVVSGGKPFEDVYDFLKEKYKLTDREELAILQIAMDSGFPIFKDRGTLGKSPEAGKETERHGVDFIKNYFG